MGNEDPPKTHLAQVSGNMEQLEPLRLAELSKTLGQITDTLTGIKTTTNQIKSTDRPT